MAEKKSEATLAPTAAPVADSRPRFQDVDVAELGGKLRIRRLEAEQIVAIKHRFALHGITSSTVKPTAENKLTLQKLVQVSLCPLDYHGLLLRGDAGFLRLAALSDETLSRVVKQTIEFNELV